MDINEVYLEAASRRVGSGHEEDPAGDHCTCEVCGDIDSDSDPEFHPEQYLTAPLVLCSVCREYCDAHLAHSHQGEWIGDECCWDERLRSSE
jgi:hypothetical protein